MVRVWGPVFGFVLAIALFRQIHWVYATLIILVFLGLGAFLEKIEKRIRDRE